MSIEQRKQQMQDILKDTISYYNEDPVNRRSVDKDGNCKYTWGNKHCAVGRYLKSEYQKENWIENDMSVYELSEYSDDCSIDQFLVDKAHGLDLQFWRDLQDVHDIVGNWEEFDEHEDGRRKYGFTDIGKERYVDMQDRIAVGEYDG